MAKFTKLNAGPSVEVKSLSVSENGTFTAPDGQAYSPVDVAVTPTVEPITITENGVYPVPKGETSAPKFGTNWEFKDVISVADFEAAIANGLPTSTTSEGNGAYTKTYEIYSGDEGVWADVKEWAIIVMEYSGETAYAIGIKSFDSSDANSNPKYACVSHCSEPMLLFVDYVLGGIKTDGWFNKSNEAIDAPILSSVPETTGINLRQVASFFGNNEPYILDGWGTITVKSQSELTSATINENGVYAAPADNSMDYNKSLRLKELITLEDFESYTSKVAPDEAGGTTWTVIDRGSGDGADFELVITKTNDVYELKAKENALTNTYTVAEGWKNESGVSIDAPWGYVLAVAVIKTDLDTISVFFNTANSVEAYGTITVDIKPRIVPLTITEAGTYDPSIPVHGTNWIFKKYISAEVFEKIIPQLTMDVEEEIAAGVYVRQYSLPPQSSRYQIMVLTDGTSSLYILMGYRIYPPMATSSFVTYIPMYFCLEKSSETINNIFSSMMTPIPPTSGWYEGAYSNFYTDTGVPKRVNPIVWYDVGTSISAELYAPFIDTGIDGYGPITIDITTS